MVSLTFSFYHHMSPRSLLDFFFPHTSSNDSRIQYLKVFDKSGASLLPSSFTPFLILLLFGFHLASKSFFLRSVAFSQSFLEPFIQIYDHQPVLKFPSNHFHIPYILSAFLSHKHEIDFCFTSTSPINDFPFVHLIKPCVCHAQLFFITELQ